MAIDWETGQEIPDQQDYATPTMPAGQSQPQQPPPSSASAVEREAAHQAFRSHVQRQDFLRDKVKDEDYVKATSLYDANRAKAENHGDAVNHAISALRWDDPNAWMTSATPTSPTAPAPTPTQGGGRDPEQDFWRIYGNKPPSAKVLEQYWPEFEQLYPGARLKRNASGYADAIILPDGRIVDTQRNSGYERSDAWQWMVVDPNAPSGTGGTTTGIGGVRDAGYGSQFSDPSTKQFEDYLNQRIAELRQPVNDPSREALARLLDQQTQLFQQQQQAQMEANKALQARKAAAQTSLDRMLGYVNERATKLQGPAYTGTEQEILRTQALDPIEGDRQAALRRALDNIGSRGFDPTSGIAQDLLRQVNASFDRERNASQNDLAYRQINEQRSREQEAQQLLQYIPQAQDAAARGDLEFLQMLDAAINSKGVGAITSASQSASLGERTRQEEQARRDELLARSGQLWELPANAAQLGMAALGQAPNPASLTQQSIQLAQLAQNQRGQDASFWLALGQSFAPFFG